MARLYPGIKETILGGKAFWLVTGESVEYWFRPLPTGPVGKHGVIVNDRRWYSVVNGKRIVPTKWNPIR